MTWDRTNWAPYPTQREILLDRTRNKVVVFGRRAGKSQTGGHMLVPEAFRAWYESEHLEKISKRREFWIVGPGYSDSEKEFRVFWEAIQRLQMPMDTPGSYYNPESGTMVCSLFNRRFIVHAKSAMHPESLVGEGLSGVILSEAAKLKPSTWIKYLRPMLADFTGWSAFLSTPEGKNWYYDLYMTGLDPKRTDWRAWRAPSWVNPYLYPGGVDEGLLENLIEARRKHRLDEVLPTLKMIHSATHGLAAPTGIHPEIWAKFLDMSTEMFNQEEAALFTEYVGRVFKNFDEEIHVTDQTYEESWETYACADFGFTNPFVWLLIQIDPHHKRVHVLDEYYEINRTTTEAATDILSRNLAPRTIRMFYPDPAEPDRARELSRMLQLKAYKGGSIDLQGRLEWIRRHLKLYPEHLEYGHPEKRPGLTVHRRCVNTIRELNDYRYPKTAKEAGERGRSAPEVPMDKDNHSPEALGRFFSGMFGSPFTKVRQSKVQVGSRRG
jgi:hypothetical protein